MKPAYRRVNFTDFGIWIRENCLHTGLTVTNLDYVIRNFNKNIFFMLEEKCKMARLQIGQEKTFRLLDQHHRLVHEAQVDDFEYWGFYLLQFPNTLPENGMKLNYIDINQEDLIRHMNCEKRFCDPLF